MLDFSKSRDYDVKLQSRSWRDRVTERALSTRVFGIFLRDETFTAAASWRIGSDISP